MQQIPDLTELVTLPYVYEAVLVGAGTIVVAAVIAFRRTIFTPWWEARMVTQQRENKTNTEIANDLWYLLRSKVKDGELTVDEAVTYFHRFANLVPLRELLPDGMKTLKEELQEKHPKKEEPTVITKPKLGMLAQMTARLKTSTAI